MNINNILAIALLVVVIPLLWIGVGLKWLDLPGEVLGATISVWTMIAMFYFRKRVK